MTTPAAVPPPWFAPVWDERTLLCWGREHVFADGPLPARITSQGADLLAAPMTLEAVVDGAPVVWSESRLGRTMGDAEGIGATTTTGSDALELRCALRIEFDGTTRVDLSLVPRRAARVDSLALHVPLRRDLARLFHHASVYPTHVWDWPTRRINAGAVPDAGLALPFVFHLWVGDDERGLQLFAESDQALRPGDAEAVITLTPRGDAMLLRIELLRDTPLDGPWHWTFGLVATPVKPYPADYLAVRYCQMGGYDQADSGNPFLQTLTQLGVTHVGTHEKWSDEQSLPRPQDPARLDALIDTYAARGIKLVPYTGCYMSTRSPEYDRRRDALPLGDHYQYQRPDNGDVCRVTCNNTDYPELLLATYREAFNRHRLGGLYLDGLTCPLPCTNTAHGCGYVDIHGATRPTMPIWRTRDLMKGLRRLVDCGDTRGLIVAHTSASILLPALSLADLYFEGEHLLGHLTLGTPAYPEAILRAEMAGHPFGIPGTQLPIRGDAAARQRARALCLLHDIRMIWNPEHQADLWRALDGFDARGAHWSPFYAQRPAVAVAAAGDVRASAYVQPGRGALVCVANLDDTAQNAVLTPEFEVLGGPVKGELSLQLAPGEVRYVTLEHAHARQRTRLVFSLDQGFGNGVVVQRDRLAVHRIVEALRPLTARYDVAVIVNPMVADRNAFRAVLDTLDWLGMPFIFDIYTSDAYTLGPCSEQNAPTDPSHGLTITPQELTAFAERYPRALVGIRFAEVFAQDFTVRAIRTTNPEWGKPCQQLPVDAFFQPELVRAYLDVARRRGLWAQWGDWHWSAFADWDAPQRDNEAALAAVLADYPGIVTPTYNNNEPSEHSVARLPHWERAVQHLVAHGAAGFGLSNQSWLRRDETATPVEDMLAWARSVPERGGSYQQFEPVWYWFELPRGTFEQQEYTHDPQWRNRGMPRPHFERLRALLLELAAGTE